MAKRNFDQGDSDQGEVRIFYAEMKGNNQSLQDAVKSMLAAIRATHTLVPQRIPHAPAGAIGAPSATTIDGEATGAMDTDAQPPDAETPAPPKRSRGTGPKKDRNAGIDLVPDLDFMPKGKTPLTTFFTEKAPKSDMEMILVLLYHMQEELKLASVGLGHIRTGFKHVAEQPPADLRGTIRNMKREKAWVSYSAMEAIKVTTIGENVVEHNLPASKKS